MRKYDALLRYFLTGTAEDDRSFLDRAFISHEQLTDILSIDPGTMRILAGSKGIGKTAIFEWLTTTANRRKLPALLLRPDDLDTRSVGTALDIGSLKRGFYEALVMAIAVALGKQLRGFLRGPSAKLYQAAMAAGAANPDFVGKVLELLSTISVPVSRVNGVQLAKDLAGKAKPNGLVQAINLHLLSKGTALFLLFDDTDQVVAPGEASQLNRIWALLLAVRRIAGECLGLRCIVSLRTETWVRLISESAGQRDQTDHLRGLVIPLRASDDLMERILRRRLTLAATEIGRGKEDPEVVFFEGNRVRLPTSDETRTWSSFILKSARERPRDAIQLVRVLADRAKENQRELIGDVEADEGMKKYSEERVRDLSDEFARDCESLRKVVESFARGDFEMDFENLRTHLKTVGSGFSLTIRGQVIKPSDDDDAISLLRFLHETGFINPRVSDPRKPRGFRHTTFQDDPYFVAKANWNNLQAAAWEIHPAFRSYLIGARESYAARR